MKSFTTTIIAALCAATCFAAEPVGDRDVKVALYTNAVIDAALVPNVGAELSVGKRWSARGEYMHAWWGGGNRVWRIYGGGAEVRYWFDNSERHAPMEGNHLGVFANLFTYDFKPFKNKAGIQSPDCSYSVGISYGHSFAVAKNFNIDISVGVGYLGGHYTRYDEKCHNNVCRGKHRLSYFGPTKLDVSLVWVIGGNSKNPKVANP